MTMDATDGVGFKPLYSQVRERLVARLVDGSWQPGMLLPSEQELARQLVVSQGTVRKALDAMAAEHLLVRKQGRGTFVAEPEESRILFQFFRLVADDGERAFPVSVVMSLKKQRASAAERAALALGEKALVWRIERVRSLRGAPVLVETILLDTKRFADLGALEAIPNNVYRLYSQRYGITIAKAPEKLTAVTAGKADAEALGCRPETPLLRIERVAIDLEGRPVELRISRCRTEGYHYNTEG